MKPEVQIYSPKGNKSLAYVLDFVFDTFYQVNAEWIEDLNLLRPQSVLINYSSQRVEDAIHILPNDYLFQDEWINHPEIKMETWGDLPIFFTTHGEVPFDIFAAVFFLLARVEEYAEVKRDKHGRFSSKFSIFSREFIQRPVIDEWLIKFKDEFLIGKGISFPENEFKWINTFDIDVAYAYKGRSWSRVVAAAMRNVVRGDFTSFFERFGVLGGAKKDPYDTYDFQQGISQSSLAETIYFFLIGDKSQHDRNLSHKSKEMRELIQKVSTYANVGIHPSYASHENPEKVEMERKRLIALSEKSVLKSRQHFLRFSLPQTYRNLIDAGIEEEYSMGYADLPGFRAGTCTPFYFFDLERNYATRLKVYPLVVMDASLRDYLKLEAQEGLVMVKALTHRVKSVNGVFVSLWHNDTLRKDNNKGWRDAYRAMAEYLNSL